MMKLLSAIPRILLGLAFGVLPLMAIFHLMPTPPQPPPAADFAAAMMKTGYLLYLVWATEILAGVLILVGVFVPFALVLLAPVLVNIVLFHVFLDRNGLLMALFLALLAIVVAWQHRDAFRPLFGSGMSQGRQAREMAA
jgi:putative oxidoreductase